MSKMGKNVLILPGAVAADVEDDEDDLADTSEPSKTDVSFANLNKILTRFSRICFKLSH